MRCGAGGDYDDANKLTGAVITSVGVTVSDGILFVCL